ncbi:putative phage abortive infection protein [Phocaeicola paurosaccharolyticus]|uniref:putative phage abortive infection protein n=1 Tax=Phocaeicola paurosaccharolyticus TaxID=732242 RepID=UPI00046929A5|nr:putative phage abortive infection protein [Phocaeicola paurosaccharolyticus]
MLVPRNSLLGHYFRHLYQTIQFIAKEEDFKENDKYNYAKMVRAQLSDFEQALLYYNSLSVMGQNWIKPIGKNNIKEMCLIARFRLIKNMPYYFEYFGIRPGNLFVTEKNEWERLGKKFFEIEFN